MTKRLFWVLVALFGLVWTQTYIACGPGDTSKETTQEATTNQEGQKEAAGNDASTSEPASEAPTSNEPSTEGSSGSETTKEQPAADVGVEKPAAEQASPDAGTPETPSTENVPETSVGGVTMTFNPKSGSQIDVKDVCIDVKFSAAVDKTDWEVTWAAKGGKVSQLLLPLDSAGNSARICFQDFLTQKTQYTLTVRVKNASTGVTGKATATYTTKEPFKGGKPGSAGLTVNLQLNKVLEPALVNTLLGTIQPSQILPILMHLHSRDKGTSGSILMIGGLGRTPSGQPHQGKDVFDNLKDPVSVAMPGQFNGNLFTAGPATFRVTLGNIILVLNQFRLSGLFNSAGDSFSDVRFSGLVDSNALKAALGLDPCTLLVGKCFKDKSGKTVIQMVGQMKSIKNPVAFSALVTNPLYLETDLSSTPTLDVYATEELAANGVTVKWSTCKNSGDANAPCDKGKGAVVAAASVTSKVTIDASKKKATVAVSAGLSAATWYRMAVTAKSSGGKTYTTFTAFKTK